MENNQAHVVALSATATSLLLSPQGKKSMELAVDACVTFKEEIAQGDETPEGDDAAAVADNQTEATEATISPTDETTTPNLKEDACIHVADEGAPVYTEQQASNGDAEDVPGDSQDAVHSNQQDDDQEVHGEDACEGIELSAGSILEVNGSSIQLDDDELAELRIDVNIDDDAAQTQDDSDLDLDSDSDSEEDDEQEHEPVDKSERSSFGSGTGSLPTVPLTITYPVNEMEVVTNRGGRSGSLSKFLDDADLYRRRSLTSYNDDVMGTGPFSQKKLTLSMFLDMAIDPILEVLDDSDSDVRVWLMQSDTVEAVLQEFVKPPVFSGEPHEEYGYYKNYFICSEIIMKLYTGEEDLYESFSSDSSSGSAAVSSVFGCQDGDDLEKWELLYSIFSNPAPLDEMQLLFFSKALVRLHDGFCLEDGYVPNVLRRFLPRVMPHLYSNTIKYMLTLILQSYESVHPITGRNDAMEIIVPLLTDATRLQADKPLNPAAVENASNLLVDMLQANQADRLGAFCRREGGVYLSKYFVRDQFGTIRGFESMTHGYHNFLQFMLLDELSKWPSIVNDLFENALSELQDIQSKKVLEVSGCLNVQAATELLLLFKKHGVDMTSEEPTPSASAAATAADEASGYGNPYSDSYPGSPRQSTLESSMYNLSSLSRADQLWSNVLSVATKTAERFCSFLNSGLPSSVEIALAKHLHALVHLGNADLDQELHKGALMQRYLHALETRPSFDMLIIRIVPAVAYIIKDTEGLRSRDSWLTLDLFDEVDGASSLPQLIVRADEDLPALKIYAGLLKDVIDEVLTTPSPSVNNITLQRLCKRCPPWGSPRYSRRSSSSPKRDAEQALTPSTSPQKQVVEALPSPSDDSLKPAAAVTPTIFEQVVQSPCEPAPESPEQVAPSPSSRRTSSARSSSARSSQRSDKHSSDHASPKEPTETDSGKKSSHYIKQMLQTPVFRGSMRLGSVIKTPEKPATEQDEEQTSASAPSSQRGGSFGWNTMLKRLRKSFVAAGSGEKGEKKLLQITNEPYVPPSTSQSTQADVLVVDTSKGEDVSKLVHRDSGVHVMDVPKKPTSDKPDNTITSGYMYKSKLPETGQRNLWERLYFVLNRQEGSLSYYVSESHARDRTYLRGTARPTSVTEGIPVSVSGQYQVFGFQINTQGHGAFMVIVDSIDTRLSWLTEIVTCVSALSPPAPQKRLSLIGDESAASAARFAANGGQSWSKQQLKTLVVDYYKNLFGPQLRFNTPMDAPASFWMEEKIDNVADSCVLSSNLPDCVPFWGEFHGYKRLCDFWKTRDETIERSSGRVLRIVVDEDEETAVVMTSTTYRILRNSQTVTEESCDILNMSFGAIISIHCTFDSFRIAEAFTKDGVSAS